MTRFAYRAATSAAAAIPIAFLLAGCSSGSGGSYGGGGAASSPSSVAAAPSTAAAGAGAGSTGGQATPTRTGAPVTATEQEFSITLSAKTFKPGTYTFTVHNMGHFQHNLTIEGPGVDRTASPTVPGGGTGTVTVTLQKGSYELWCSVDSHKDRGMDLNIVVS